MRAPGTLAVLVTASVAFASVGLGGCAATTTPADDRTPYTDAGITRPSFGRPDPGSVVRGTAPPIPPPSSTEGETDPTGKTSGPATCGAPPSLGTLDGIGPDQLDDTTVAARFEKAGGVLPDEGWRPPTGSDEFDWDADGTPDVLATDADARTVTVSWRAGNLTVTDAPSGRVGGDDGEAVRPAAVGDVTDDGWPDLIVAVGGVTRVLVGTGPSETPRELAWGEIGESAGGWVIPRRPKGESTEVFVPTATAEPMVVFDANADGTDDFVVTDVGPNGPYFATWFAGQRC